MFIPDISNLETKEETNMIKIFDYDFEAFKKYLNWALHLPKFIINGKFKNQK